MEYWNIGTEPREFGVSSTKPSGTVLENRASGVSQYWIDGASPVRNAQPGFPLALLQSTRYNFLLFTFIFLLLSFILI